MHEDLAKWCNEKEFYELDLYRSSRLGGVYTVLMDEQFTLIYGNDLYFQVHEFEPEELLGQSCTIFIHPEDLGHVRDVLDRTRELGLKNAEWEMRIITGKKNLKHMLVSGSFNMRNGQEVFDGYITDISKQKRMEQQIQKLTENEAELQKQIELYRMTDLGGVFSVAIDEYFTLLYGNDKYYNLHGYTKESMRKLIGNRCCEYMHPDDLLQVRSLIDKALLEGRSKIEWTMRITTPKGNLRFILCTGMLDEQDGQPIVNGMAIDVTKQKETLEALRQSEEKFRIATENSDVVFWTYFFDSKEIVQTVSSQKVHGHAEVVYNAPDSLIDEGYIRADDAERFREMYRELENGIKTACGDFWTRTIDGEGWWCERIEYTTVFDESGRPKCAHAIGRDVTAEKLAETRYSEELSYKNAIASQGFVGSMRADLATGCVEDLNSANKWFHRVYAGKSYNECIDDLAASIIDPGQRDEFASCVRADALMNDFRQERLQREFCVQRHLYDGSSKWISTSVKLLKKPNSDHVVVFLYSYDVNREEMFKRAMERISFNNYDLIGCIHGPGDAFTLLSGCKRDTEFKEEGFHEALKSYLTRYKVASLMAEDICVEKIIDVLKKQEVYSLEFTQQGSTGALLSKQFRFSYIEEKAQKILFTINDFTDVVNKEKEYQDTLQKALDEVKRANDAKSDFMARMSHDMRTPMNGILGLTHLALELSDCTSEATDYLLGVQSSAHYLLSLINDVLDMSRIESNMLVLNPRPVHANRIVEDIMASVRAMVDEKHIDFQLKLINTDLGYIKVDKIRLQQIFINILTNAAKFTPSGGRIEWIIECLGFEEDILHDRIVVRDNGIGMSEEFLPKLFEPFEQEQSEVSAQYEGTGLGMPIVKNLVEAMGGSIEVRSRKGVGTEVIMFMDFERISHFEEGSIVEPMSVDLTGKHILVCEDHALNMQISCKLLEKEGALVTPARNGKEGVDAFLRSSEGFFDAVLMDVRMPVMDGLDASRNIRGMNRIDAKKIPIIAMTANAYDSDREKTRQAGMDAHLAKPIEPQVLYQVLGSLIES
ncbi:MAG: PAS domain S-box protein [Gordonibacter sp.]|nr:PAS domain S-box protein [Gordonibacter sp.]